MKRIFAALFLCVLVVSAFAQSPYAPLNEDYYHWVDRYEVKSGRVMPNFFTGVKAWRRSDIISLLDSISPTEFTSKVDKFNYQYMQDDNWEFSQQEAAGDSKKPFLKHFYRKKGDLYHVNEKWFNLHINPVIYFGAGKDSRQSDDLLYINTRGIEVRGMVDKKVGFYTYLTDNQMLLPSYADELFLSENLAVPHEGFWKGYKEGKAVDYLQARGYITFNATRHINMQFGHDRFFVGNGYRSFVYSDFGPPVWFLRANVKVWKINYLFQLNQMTADVVGNRGGLTSMDKGYPLKYNALHHLSINIGKKVTLGVFESVIFSADDPNGPDHFRLDYLNPIIFYRAIEQQDGSSDNVLLGFDFKVNPVRKLSFYGQFVLDEFVISHIRAQDGWWANKFAIQFGGKYVDVLGVPNLDIQGEYNVVRPYTYSHSSTFTSYSSYKQPIAHPLGANFHEVVGIMRYQPLPRLNLTGKLIFIRTGRDAEGENWGGNILNSNRDLEQEFDNKIAQGQENNIGLASFTASWQLKHNLFVDGLILIRDSKSDYAKYQNKTNILSLALRWNIPQRLYEF
jgi:hypothetical protein